MIKFKTASKYDIHIKHTVNGGMIVRIGCATLAFDNYKPMMKAMEEYYENPEGVEKVYNDAIGPPNRVESVDAPDIGGEGRATNAENRERRFEDSDSEF